MKKLLLVIIALFLLCSNPVTAANLNKYSNDAKVVSALRVLENVGSQDVITRLEKSSTTVMFYDLSLIDFSYAKHYAAASTDENGNNVILINERFKSAPVEAIACLIAHESVHMLPQATLDEETQATLTEVKTWLKLRNTVTSFDNELVKRQQKLANVYESSVSGENSIKELIASNSFYQKQLAMN